jgi:two-component system, sensor histidine kinase PdtaS
VTAKKRCTTCSGVVVIPSWIAVRIRASCSLGAAITRPREIITVDSVIKVVANYYGPKPSDIKSERRHKSVATPRAVAIEIGLTAVRGVDDEFGLVSGVDISERKQRERDLTFRMATSETEQRELRYFRLAVEAAQTGMIMIDRNGRLVLVNSRTEALFGYSRDELIGQQLELLIPERFRARHVGFRTAFFAEPSMRTMGSGRDLYGRHKDGTEVPIEIGLTPVQTTEGNFVLSSIVDITERKRAEKMQDDLVNQLKTLNAELEERVQARTVELRSSLRERDVLIQEIHHRVKNNLRVISSLINIQTKRLEPGKNRDALEECQTRVQAIALIHEKLYQSRDYSRVPFSDYVRFHATGISPGGVNLELAIDDVTLGVDTAIPCGLLLNELITNALKHGFKDRRRGKIRVELTRQDERRLRLAVTDNGVGLPDGFDLATSQSMGLRLIVTLAKQLGAQLEVGSGEGASFSVTFPVE